MKDATKSYVYNDAEMMMATQVAYLNFNGEDVCVGDLVNHILTEYGEKKDGKWILKSEYQDLKNSGELSKQLEVAANIEQIASTTKGIDGWEKWRIVDVCNDENGSGFYGMLIDTGDGNAIVGCRGSESFDDHQVFKDWIISDVGLMDSVLTEQQFRGRRYMQELYNKYGDKYNSFSVTGHSLGGNLAEDMTVNAPEEMLEKIDHCISFDGPGHSNEYANLYRNRINRVNDKMDHYKWSWVSSLLPALPGVRSTTIKAHDDPSKDGLLAMVFRHDTHNVEMDSEGNIKKETESDELSKIAKPIVDYLEKHGNNPGIDLILHHNPFLPYAFDFVCGLKLIKNVIINFARVKESVEKLCDNLYYNYIAPNVTGDFEINESYLLACSENVRTYSRKLAESIDEINVIRRNWNFQATSGAYYRSQLWLLQSGFERDKDKLDKLADVAQFATNSYGKTDRFVASKFALFKKYEG